MLLKDLYGVIRRWFLPAFSQTQKEALLDALVLTMFADSRTRPEEKEMIEDHVLLEVWESEEDLRIAYLNSCQRALDFYREENHIKQYQYIDDIANRLESEAQKKTVFSDCIELVQSDGEKTESEIELVELLSKKL